MQTENNRISWGLVIILDIIQASLFYYFCDLYISKVEKTSSTETIVVLDFESPSKFWGFRIAYQLRGVRGWDFHCYASG